MPNIFSKKKKPSAAAASPPPTPQPQNLSEKTTASPDKKSKANSVRDRESNKRPKSPRSSKSFGRTSQRRDSDSDSHPLNLPPEELRRWATLSAMSSPTENGVDPMETTPAPEAPPGAFPVSNGVNGEQEDENDGPAPPPHKTPTSPATAKAPEVEVPQHDPEACKAAGNKFYKAGQYQKAIDEYSKGWSTLRGIAAAS